MKFKKNMVQRYMTIIHQLKMMIILNITYKYSVKHNINDLLSRSFLDVGPLVCDEEDS